MNPAVVVAVGSVAFLVEHFDGSIFPLVRYLLPVLHMDEYAVGMSEDNGFDISSKAVNLQLLYTKGVVALCPPVTHPYVPRYVSVSVGSEPSGT